MGWRSFHLMGVEENASKGYQHHLNISEQWRFKCILHPHALFSCLPINCIDLLRVEGYNFIDPGNSLTQQNCLPAQDRSIPPLFPFGYIMVIYSASPKFHNTYLSSRKEGIKTCLFQWETQWYTSGHSAHWTAMELGGRRNAWSSVRPHFQVHSRILSIFKTWQSIRKKTFKKHWIHLENQCLRKKMKAHHSSFLFQSHLTHFFKCLNGTVWAANNPLVLTAL